MDGIKFVIFKILPEEAKRYFQWNNEYEQNPWKLVKDKGCANTESEKESWMFRPISLLPCAHKLLEKMLCTRPVYWAETQDVLSSRQYSFRKGRQTRDCLGLLTTDHFWKETADAGSMHGKNFEIERGTAAGREIFVVYCGERNRFSLLAAGSVWH
jgi:hypothetical protein